MTFLASYTSPNLAAPPPAPGAHSNKKSSLKILNSTSSRKKNLLRWKKITASFFLKIKILKLDLRKALFSY
jgi:hypothetical protein